MVKRFCWAEDGPASSATAAASPAARKGNLMTLLWPRSSRGREFSLPETAGRACAKETQAAAALLRVGTLDGLVAGGDPGVVAAEQRPHALDPHLVELLRRTGARVLGRSTAIGDDAL